MKAETASFIESEQAYQRFRVGLEACGVFEPGLLAAAEVG